MHGETTGRMDRGDGVELAWARLDGRSPTVVFLPGFNSDMDGVKALELRDACAGSGHAMLRLDYSGHGRSGGAFTDGSIGRWSTDARLLIERLTEGELILVGSSMGGWIALIGIAAAPDFTERLMWDAMSPAEQAELVRTGRREIPSQYGDPYVITIGLIEDGRRHMLLGAPIAFDGPVRLLQGQRDDDVPWEQALTLADRLTSTDVRVTLIKDGDHRLSRPQDLRLLRAALGALLGEDGA